MILRLEKDECNFKEYTLLSLLIFYNENNILFVFFDKVESLEKKLKSKIP